MLRPTFRVLSVISAPLWLVACSSPGGNPNGPPAGRGGPGGMGAPVPVVTARVEQRAVPVILPAVGTVEAIASVDIRAQVTGQLSAIHFEEGQDVQQGQPLFSLDSRPFRTALLQAEAVLARDTATLQNAQAQQARAENLFQRGLVARDQFESQRAIASALAATVEADKAAAENARLNIQYTEIKAPISGRTGTLGVHEGDLVRANDTTPLVVINQLAPVYVTFSVPGRYLSEIRRYQAQKRLPVTVVSPSGSNPPSPAPEAAGSAPGATGGSSEPSSVSDSLAPRAEGVVSFIDNAVDATTGMIRLKGMFPNGNRQLWPGAFVQVTVLMTTDPDALVVPPTAVQASQDGQFIYVVKPDGTVAMRSVRVGRQQGDMVVITDGLTAGEVVVTDGQLRLTPGARVTERGQPVGGPAPGGGGVASQPNPKGSR